MTTETPQHRLLVHRILLHAERAFDRAREEEPPGLAEVLTTAAEQVWSEQPLGDTAAEPVPAWVTAEAAWEVAAAAGIRPAGLTDPNLPRMLAHLDAQDHGQKRHWLRLAVGLTDALPARTAEAQEATTRFQQSRPRRSGPCPCSCNSGAACGGCGHAGCGGRG